MSNDRIVVFIFIFIFIFIHLLKIVHTHRSFVVYLENLPFYTEKLFLSKYLYFLF